MTWNHLVGESEEVREILTEYIEKDIDTVMVRNYIYAVLIQILKLKDNVSKVKMSR